MWRRLPEAVVAERAAIIARENKIPKLARALIATFVFAATLYGISYLDALWQRRPAAAEFNLQNASLPALLAVFAATAAFMYFLIVKNRKTPVIFICYSCEEAFHAAPTCPACSGTDVSDIRFAEWIE
ncbi:MAG: hypothetical protein KF713_12840 [Turneriella sp.]|nr:hypothetical protein [Turneriella sp.]